MAWFEHGTARVHYEVSGDGDPVLLTPGFSMTIDDVSALGEALSARYRVIAADLPGSGQSGPQPRHYTRTYHEDDARVLLALLASLDLPAAHVIGHSDGGESALWMAALQPERIRSVVAWGAMGYIDKSLLSLLAVFESVVDEPIEPLKEYADLLKATYGRENARAMIKSFAEATRAIIEDGGDLARSRAGSISCPVLLISGEHDPFAPPPLIPGFTSAVRNVEVIEVPGAGHDVHRTHADWMAETILAWLAAH